LNDVQAPAAPPVERPSGPRLDEPALHLLLALDEAAARAFKREAATLLRPVRRPVARRLRQVFWDTAQHRIGRAGVALGIQTTGQRRQQILREIRHAPAGGRRLLERIGPLDGDALDPTRLAFLPGIDPGLVTALATEMLVPVFGVDSARTSWRCAEGDTQIVATLDTVVVEAAGTQQSLTQLDLAVVGGPPDGVYRLARRLLGTIPFELAPLDPVQHGYLMAAGFSGAVDPAAAELTPAMAARQGFLAISRAGAGAVRQTMRALHGDLGAEPIHEARVALRRLRSVLSVFRPLLPPYSGQQFGRSLSEFAALLGEAREWDVWLEATVVPLRRALNDDDPLLDLLIAGAGAERQLAEVAVADAARSREFVMLSLGLGAWFDAEIWPETPSEAESALLATPLVEFARQVLRKRHRRLVKAAEGWADSAPERLHALRIEAKKLRYSVDFMRSLFPAKPVRRYLAGLKVIQDILGAVNDAVVARQLVAQLAAPSGEEAARATGLVTGWTAAEATGARRRFAEAWTEFAEAKRFWKD
jgi:CHAD domain-containing protein